jgi:hypothetical protein
MALEPVTGDAAHEIERKVLELESRLLDFLRLIDGMSLRLLDFLSGLVDPAELPSAAHGWRRLEAARRAAYDSRGRTPCYERWSSRRTAMSLVELKPPERSPG